MLALYLFALTAVSCNMNNKNQENTTSLFPKGHRLLEDWFTDVAFLSPLVSKDKNNEFSAGSVTFETGARIIGIPILKVRF